MLISIQEPEDPNYYLGENVTIVCEVPAGSEYLNPVWRNRDNIQIYPIGQGETLIGLVYPVK